MSRTGPSSRRALLLAVLLLLPAVSGAAAPNISFSGVVNAAGFMPPPRPGSAIAQGSIFSIFGAGLGPDPAVMAPEPPLLNPPVLPVAGASGVRAYEDVRKPPKRAGLRKRFFPEHI